MQDPRRYLLSKELNLMWSTADALKCHLWQLLLAVSELCKNKHLQIITVYVTTYCKCSLSLYAVPAITNWLNRLSAWIQPVNRCLHLLMFNESLIRYLKKYVGRGAFDLSWRLCAAVDAIQRILCYHVSKFVQFQYSKWAGTSIF